MTIDELIKENAIKKWVNCEKCGKKTWWYHRDSYYTKGSPKPICKKCREASD